MSKTPKTSSNKQKLGTISTSKTAFASYYELMKKFLSRENVTMDSLMKMLPEKGINKDIKCSFDQAFRHQVLLLLSQESTESLKKILQLSVTAALTDILSANTPFQLFSDVFNTKVISFCEEIFSFMEETVLKLKETSLFMSGRNTLLRMCNDLLRRLSKSQNTLFCGRIQLFLSRLFPLDEKSGLNLMSHFNTENVTPYVKQQTGDMFQRRQSHNEPMDLEEEEGEMKEQYPCNVDFELYVKFWSIQDFFRCPAQCYSPNKWRFFTNNADDIICCFSSFHLDTVSPKKLSTDTRFTKYLTNPKLFDLQLMDPTFRCYILIQMKILFQYLSSQIKFKSSDQELSEEQAAWVKKSSEIVTNLLESTTSNGSELNTVVNHILQREESWSQWKNEGCPTFLKQPDPEENLAVSNAKKRRINPLVDKKGAKIFRFSDPELNRLWNIQQDNYEACRNTDRLFRPTLGEYFADAKLEMDPKELVEDQYQSINNENWQWRSLRYLSRNCPQFYQNWSLPFKTLKEYIAIIMEKIDSEENNQLRTSNGEGRNSMSGNNDQQSSTEDQDASNDEDDDIEEGEEEYNKSPQPEQDESPEIKEEEIDERGDYQEDSNMDSRDISKLQDSENRSEIFWKLANLLSIHWPKIALAFNFNSDNVDRLKEKLPEPEKAAFKLLNMKFQLEGDDPGKFLSSLNIALSHLDMEDLIKEVNSIVN